MALRFFLLSAVASLGLTLPEEGEIRAWAAQTQIWTNAKRAEWDARSMGEGRVGGPTSRPEMSIAWEAARGDGAFDAAIDEMLWSFLTERCKAPAREEGVATLAASTFEPMMIGEDLYTGTAYELNRAADGCNMARCAAGDREAPAEFRSRDLVKRCPTDVTVSSCREERGTVEGLAEKLCGQSRSDFEPMVVGDDLYVGVAYKLNRASEGLGLASEGFTSQPPVHRGSEPAVASRVSQLSVALRLTREAVYAWSNLLHGPAVVAITR